MHIDVKKFIYYPDTTIQKKIENLKSAYSKIKERENNILALLAKITDLKDHELSNHSKRITEYVKIMVEYIISNPKLYYNLSQVEADNIANCSQLHDIGKISIPDEILFSTLPLTEKEFTIMKTHTIKGVELLNNFKIILINKSFFKIATEISLGHHEKWNGKGYPFGLKEREIPLSARIVAIADVYDALISERTYKKAFSHKDSIDIIYKNKGTHFDPTLVNIFIQKESDMYKISETWAHTTLIK